MMKTKQANFRASDEELALARQAANIERMNLSEFVRELLRSDLRAKGLWPPPGPTGTAPAGGIKC